MRKVPIEIKKGHEAPGGIRALRVLRVLGRVGRSGAGVLPQTAKTP